MALFETAISLICPVEKAFEFYTTPAQVSQITHPAVSLTYVDPPARLDQGVKFTLQLSGMGQVQKFEHEVVEYEAPFRFVELATKTPMKLWRHEHIFEQAGDGAVRIIDRIEFSPPGGMIGFILTEERILDGLRKAFAHQHEHLPQHLGDRV